MQYWRLQEEMMMQFWQLVPDRGFNILSSTARSQAATMVLESGESTGGPRNSHDGSDQWLFVLTGSGRAAIGDETVELQPETLVLIEAGENHEIDNTGEGPLEILAIYGPPAY
jgi:mannose-6-phosphate isomerase-like protein (cupin superfamily)